MANTVHVSKISQQTSEKEVRDFFSFCGKISSLSVTPVDGNEQSATVTFEKETAAKTALLLDNTQLGPSQVQVTDASSLDDIVGKNVSSGEETTGDDVEQEDKPRSRILAEYLAHGYAISDKAIERALALDQQHGISNRFTVALQQFDSKYKATEKAQTLDAKFGASEKAFAGWRGINSYFEKALGTPSGQKVRDFYVQGNKQVMDVHNEARHLANLKSGKPSTTESVPGTDKTTCSCGGDTTLCGCESGKCSCASCPNNTSASTGVKEATQIPGTTETTCSCAGDSGVCGCEPGNCRCANCPKNTALKA